MTNHPVPLQFALIFEADVDVLRPSMAIQARPRVFHGMGADEVRLNMNIQFENNVSATKNGRSKVKNFHIELWRAKRILFAEILIISGKRCENYLHWFHRCWRKRRHSYICTSSPCSKNERHFKENKEYLRIMGIFTKIIEKVDKKNKNL